jgi:hypothetical protein
MDSSADREYDLAILMPIEAEFSECENQPNHRQGGTQSLRRQPGNENQKITAQDFKAAIDKLNVDLWAFIRS